MREEGQRRRCPSPLPGQEEGGRGRSTNTRIPPTRGGPTGQAAQRRQRRDAAAATATVRRPSGGWGSRRGQPESRDPSPVPVKRKVTAGNACNECRFVYACVRVCVCQLSVRDPSPPPQPSFPPHYTIMFTIIERAVPFFDFLPSEMCCIRTFLLHLNRKFICHSNLPGGDIFVASHQCTPHECEHILCPACLPASSR